MQNKPISSDLNQPITTLKHRNRLIALTVIILIVGLSLFTANQFAQVSPFWHALFIYFDAMDAQNLILPLLTFFLVYTITAPIWFTDFKDWLILRTGIQPLVKYTYQLVFTYVLSTYLLGILTSMVSLGLIYFARFSPWTSQSGILGRLPIWQSLLLSILIIFTNITCQIMISLAILPWCHKGWQLIILSYFIYEIGPILLFIVGILPEQWIPISILQKLWLYDETNWQSLGYTLLAAISVTLLGIILFQLGVRIKTLRGWHR